MSEIRGELLKNSGLIIIAGLIGWLLSAVFFETYKKAEAALLMGNENKKDVAVLQTCIQNIDKNYEIINTKLDKLLGWNK